ncbi:MAG: hypothetical protein J0M19_11915 [Sphingomonadales bacterium]|nr:hypothetical protein [Sphingomonadales bacterium]
MYYKSPKEPTPLGEIVFAGAVISFAPTDDSFFRFQIELSHRVYVLEASSQVDLDLWVRSLLRWQSASLVDMMHVVRFDFDLNLLGAANALPQIGP